MPFQSANQTQLEIIAKHIQSFSSLQVSHFFIYETLWRRFALERENFAGFMDVEPALLIEFVQWLKSKQD